MKTNHQRNYKDDGSFRDRLCRRGFSSRISGKSTGIGYEFTNGHRGQARAVAGAKKYIRTRDRLVNKKLAKDALRGDFE